ncbi:MAG: hypothetical protein DI533_15440 [Cereibacter sphaeroides]|uniref:Methyltransferase type 12 domain-containing protein n=1 Tax=Cereibacter sphaeroides TaxID=1063 RepID=A0A2W5SCG3_CERSP|nr:MAG: hypothetical protein DI533_15440 [Cereibacter sphaeroides]
MLSNVLSEHLPKASAAHVHRVSLELHADDGMYQGNDYHYLSCGASAFAVIDAAVAIANIAPSHILDFGAGAGRVTRWLRAGYPQAELSVTDIRPDDLAFCAREFGANTFPSATSTESLHAPDRYDLIWVGSVITHLSAAQSEKLVRKLASWLRQDGVLVVSFHGRFAAARAPSFQNYGIAAGWDTLLQDYRSLGFGYADYPSQSGYGISICSTSWTAALVERIDNARLVLLSERAWDAHHDVFALQNRPVLDGLPTFSNTDSF